MKKSLLTYLLNREIDPLHVVQKKRTTFRQYVILIYLKLACFVCPAAQNLNVLDSQWKAPNDNDIFGILAQ